MSMSRSAHIITLLSKQWRLNCSTFALQSSSELRTKVTLLRTCLCQVISLVVICWGLLKCQTYLNNNNGYYEIELQMECNQEVTSAAPAPAPGLVYVCVGSFLKCLLSCFTFITQIEIIRLKATSWR